VLNGEPTGNPLKELVFDFVFFFMDLFFFFFVCIFSSDVYFSFFDVHPTPKGKGKKYIYYFMK